jgi:transcriptional regulator with XRE-family HTH domain
MRVKQNERLYSTIVFFVQYTIVLGGGDCVDETYSGPYIKYTQERISQLRMQREVSARKMSLDLGQSISYINAIENKKALPSMTGFFKICDFLQIKPRDFFDEDSNYPERLNRLMELLKKLDDTSLSHIEGLVKELTDK